MSLFFLLVLVLNQGELEVHAFPVPTMERCVEVMPDVVKLMPSATVLCVTVSPPGTGT